MANKVAPRIVTVLTTPTLILSASVVSRNVVFRHLSAGVQLNLGTDAATPGNNIYPLLEKEEFADNTTGAIYGNVASGTCVVYIWESMD